MEWKLGEAKNKLSEVVTRATTEGPQTIRRNGIAVVVISEATYRALTGERPTIKDWLLGGPRIDGGIELPDRKQFTMRPADL